MYKSMIIVAAALAMTSLGSLMSAPAQAGGGATSAASKYNNESRTASVQQVRYHRSTQTAGFAITEFSSSSARSSVPKR